MGELQALKNTALQFYQAFNTRNLELLRQILEPTWQIHPSLPGDGSDFDKYAPIAKALLEAFPDVYFNIENIIAEGNIVAVRSVISGTQQGEWLGVPAAGKQVKILAHDFHRIENDCVAESWHVEDWLLGLQQIKN